MNLHSAIDFLLHNNEMVINVLVILVVSTTLLVLAVDFFSNGQNKMSYSGGLTIKDVESALKRILESMPLRVQAEQLAIANSQATEMSQFARSSPSEISQFEKDISNLKEQIRKKDEQLNTLNLNKELSVISSDQIEELTLKVKTLDSKLKEYEIIEDDIANLSLYQEENQKLKLEISNLKTNEISSKSSSSESISNLDLVKSDMKSATSDSAASKAAVGVVNQPVSISTSPLASSPILAASTSAPVSIPKSASTTPVKDSGSTATELSKQASSVEVKSFSKSSEKSPPKISLPDSVFEPAKSEEDDDIFAEFVSAVKEQKSFTSLIKDEKEVKKENKEQELIDDALMSEFAQAMQTSSASKVTIQQKIQSQIEKNESKDKSKISLELETSSEQLQEQSNHLMATEELNTNKMLNEVDLLNQQVDSTLDGLSSGEVLEKAINTEKLTEEALDLDNDSKENQELVNEFKNFMKKS